MTPNQSLNQTITLTSRAEFELDKAVDAARDAQLPDSLVARIMRARREARECRDAAVEFKKALKDDD